MPIRFHAVFHPLQHNLYSLGWKHPPVSKYESEEKVTCTAQCTTRGTDVTFLTVLQFVSIYLSNKYFVMTMNFYKRTFPMSIVIQVKNIESKKFDWWIFDIHKIINKKKKIIFWLHLLHQAVVIKHICSVIEDWAVNLNMYGFFCKSYAGNISSKTNIPCIW